MGYSKNERSQETNELIYYGELPVEFDMHEVSLYNKKQRAPDEIYQADDIIKFLASRYGGQFFPYDQYTDWSEEQGVFHVEEMAHAIFKREDSTGTKVVVKEHLDSEWRSGNLEQTGRIILTLFGSEGTEQEWTVLDKKMPVVHDWSVEYYPLYTLEDVRSLETVLLELLNQPIT